MRSPRLLLGSVALLVACGSTLPSFDPLDDEGTPSLSPSDAGVPVFPDAAVPRDAGVPWSPLYDAAVLPPLYDAGTWFFDAGAPWLDDAGFDAAADASGISACSFTPSCLSAGSASGSGSTPFGPLQLTGASVSYLSGAASSTLLTLFGQSGGNTLAFELEVPSPSSTPAAPAGDYAVDVWSYGAVPGDSCFSLESAGTVRVLRHRASSLPREGEEITFVGTFDIRGSVTFSGSFDLRSACGSALSFD
jgi:hypothetical protein